LNEHDLQANEGMRHALADRLFPVSGFDPDPDRDFDSVSISMCRPITLPA
jgi:hypothetical protein